MAASSKNDVAKEGESMRSLPMSAFMKGRRCVQFQQSVNSTPDNPVCCCGQPQSAHSPSALAGQDPEKAWIPETHTRLVPEKRQDGSGSDRESFSHGELGFNSWGRTVRGQTREHCSRKHITVYSDSDMRSLIHFILSKWKLHPPRLVISLLGETDRLAALDVESVMDAARETGGWIVNDGRNELPFRGSREHSRDKGTETRGVPVIGIAPLSLQEETNKKPVVDFNYTVIRGGGGGRGRRLQPCHTHFLLVADGDVPDVQMAVQAKLEMALSQLVMMTSPEKLAVPVICLVADGHMTSRTVDQWKEEDECRFPTICVMPSDVLDATAGEQDDSNMTEIDREIRDKDGNGELSDGGCIPHMETMSPVHQFYLAQAWGIKDLVDQVLSEASIAENQKAFIAAMDHALVSGRIDTVEILLQNGFDLSVYCDPQKLTVLYNKSERISLEDVGEVLLELTLGTYKPIFMCDGFSKQTSTLVKDGGPTQRDQEIQLQETEIKSPDMSGASGKPSQDLTLDLYQELFILSVVCHRAETAAYFWQHLKERISGALTATLILQQLAEVSDRRRDRSSIQNLSRTYCQLAEDLINACYAEDRLATPALLAGSAGTLWGYTPCLHLIVTLQDSTLAAQPGVHYVTRVLWAGQVSQSSLTEKWRVALCLVCPPLAPWLLTFTEGSAPLKSTPSRRVDVEFVDEDGTDDSKEIKISNVIFLILYSYILLCQFNLQTSAADIVLIIWVGALYLREFDQIQAGWSLTWSQRAKAWISDTWNQVDLLTLLGFALGMVLKLTAVSLGSARVVLAVTLMALYVRLCLQFFTAHQYAGPLLVMIRNMLNDLWYFLGVLFVFLIGYGIASQAILYPNTTDPDALARGVLFQAYFHMFGETFLDPEPDMDCSNNATLIMAGVRRCPEFPRVGVALLAVYMMISNVLLLNILIAMFSNTFTQVQEHSSLYWKVQQYHLVMEFTRRPILPPPLNLLLLPWSICIGLVSLIKKTPERSPVFEAYVLPSQGSRLLWDFEEQVLLKYLSEKEQEDSEDISIGEVYAKVSELSSKMDQILEPVSDSS
ncbi:transient receptor potential cation channel subfamily M member 2-like [Diadema antillarum]|uniref:transient receptor potential cation channel subfamily M member 2-like n=1 Tax=Diadema antillarum TaxID=105358 RepID=UPI003A881286